MKKIILPFLSILLVITAFGQGDESKPKAIITSPKMDNVVQPLFVLKADDKTVVLDNNKGEGGSILEDIDIEQIISLDVLKDGSAVAKYGEEARNGVIVIYLREFNSLPVRTKKLFEKTDVEKIKKEG